MSVRFILPLLTALFIVGCAASHDAAAQRSAGRSDEQAAPSPAQRDTLLVRIARQRFGTFQNATACLRAGIDTVRAWHVVDSLLLRPTGDMFWQIYAAGFYFSCRDRLGPEMRARFRRTMRTFTPYRGDTENHYLMHFVSLLLFSQEWPDMTGDEWFNGKSSRENYGEAHDYLVNWVSEVARYGTTEWDSPRYAYYYITPLIVLRDFTHDAELRARADMMITLMLADMAPEYLNGSYCGAHSRDADNAVTNPRNTEALSYAQLYFEDTVGMALQDLAFAARSSYQCSPLLRTVAHDRATPYLHTELRRSRAKIRFSDERFTPVYKYTWMRSDYAVGSIQGGLMQPIQQHTWDVTFASGRAGNSIFGLHPQASALEMGTFFPEEPELTIATVAATKGSYISENKWVGGSPYERVFQHHDLLIALYDIPADAQCQHIDLFLPKTLDTLERDPSGWIFCRMEGAFTAVRPLGRDNAWIEEEANWRLRTRNTPGEPIGWVVQCAPAAEISWSAFKLRARDLGPGAPRRAVDGVRPWIETRSLSGERFAVVGRTLDSLVLERNGAAVLPERTQLFAGPFVNSEVGSGVVRIEHGERHAVLDFNTITVHE